MEPRNKVIFREGIVDEDEIWCMAELKWWVGGSTNSVGWISHAPNGVLIQSYAWKHF